MFTNVPICAHCQHSQWYEVKGSNILVKRVALRCVLLRHEVSSDSATLAVACRGSCQPCRFFLKEDLRRCLSPGTAILYDGVVYSALR